MKPAPQLAKYAGQLLKASCASYAKGIRSQQRSQDHLPVIRYACFEQVMAINKAYFMAGISFFHVSARFRADFLAAIENHGVLR